MHDPFGLSLKSWLKTSFILPNLHPCHEDIDFLKFESPEPLQQLLGRLPTMTFPQHQHTIRIIIAVGLIDKPIKNEIEYNQCFFPTINVQSHPPTFNL